MVDIVIEAEGRAYERCRACGGTGRIEHYCTWPSADLETVKRYWEHRWSARYESLGIYQCRVCQRYLMIRCQSDDSGSDDIVLYVGESKRGYSFTQADLDEALREREGRGGAESWLQEQFEAAEADVRSWPHWMQRAAKFGETASDGD